MKFPERVKETTTTTGTGTVTLAGAVTGYRSFTSALSTGDKVPYCIEDGTNWEVGEGTFTTAGLLLSRDSVLASSNAGALVNFAAGAKNVFVVSPGSYLANPTVKSFGNSTGAVAFDNGSYQYATMTPTGNVTLSITNPAAAGKVTAGTLIVTGDGVHSVTYPAAFNFGAAGAPPIPAVGAIQAVNWIGTDGGTSYLAYWNNQVTQVVTLTVDPPGTVLVTGEERCAFRVPSTLSGLKLTAVAAHVTTASSGGLPTMQVRNASTGNDMLSTPLSINVSAADSLTAATPAVINPSFSGVSTGDEIAIDVDVAGTGAKGLIVELQFAAAGAPAAPQSYTFIDVQQVSNVAFAGSTIVTPSLGTSQPGDLLVVALSTKDTSAANTPTSNATVTWTKIDYRDTVPPAGIGMWFGLVTVGNAATTVSDVLLSNVAGTMIVGLVRPSLVIAYNNDKATNADFGGSTAFTVGPTTGSPPANSIFFFCLSASVAQASIPMPAGWNATGANGFTAGMATRSVQLTTSAGNGVPTALGYILANSVQTAALTLPTSCNWFGVIASFH